MSASLDAILAAEMARWEAAGLRRTIDPTPSSGERAGSREQARSSAGAPADPAQQRLHTFARDFTSNDYLSLSHHPAVIAGARAAIERFGAGGRASRLLGGGSPLDLEVEELVARWLNVEAALLFPSGYQANLGLLTALVGRGDALFSDAHNHASLIDAARLSRARVCVHRHLDLEHLEWFLRSASGARRRVVVTESVFSMDGDRAPLVELHELCARHDAWLVVDEAHAIGLLGARGAGAWAEIDPTGDILAAKDCRLIARLVAGGKALGVSGACIAGSRSLREHLVNHARSLIFTTGVSPAVSGALCASIPIAQAAEEQRRHTLALAQRVAQGLDLAQPQAAIVPRIVGDSERASELARLLQLDGFDVRAVRPPSVPVDTARLRIACHAHNAAADVEALIIALRSAEQRHEHRRTRASVPVSTRTLFVVGTDTDVGKTVVSALLARAASKLGRATYWKPVQTGDASDTDEVTRLVDGSSAACVPATRVFPLAASPHTAAAAAGARIDVDELHAQLCSLRADRAPGTLIVELAGGLLVPYDERTTQADWLAREDAAIVLVARSGLGTLNHTLLTLEALAARALGVRALFLVGDAHASNRATLGRMSGIEHIFELPRFATLEPAALERWLAANDLASLFRD